MALPLVGSSVVQESAAPTCSGAVALRRVTTLLQGARRADAQGEHQQAIELYSEVLKVQRSLSRAPLGSIGKSLREVAAGVEARLAALKQELRDSDDGSATGSIPRVTGGGATASRGPLDELRSPRGINTWGSAAAALLECPPSARDSYVASGRPTTRDGGLRPVTQETRIRTQGLESGWRTGFEGSTRPSTRGGPLEVSQCLDGVRPSTREGRGIQKMIDGAGRPQTRDGVRPPTRNGPGERRAQDVSIRQVTGRRKRLSQQAPADILILDDESHVEFFGSCPECLSPCLDADESVELLE